MERTRKKQTKREKEIENYRKIERQEMNKERERYGKEKIDLDKKIKEQKR